MKKQLNKLIENPVYGIAVVFVVLGILGAGVVLLLAGEDEDKGPTAKTTTEEKKDKQEDLLKKIKKRKVKPAPVVNSAGTVDVARSEGRLAIAQARGRIKNPSAISVRTSAAPKQEVTVDYQLACTKAVGKQFFTRIGKDRYRVTPPNVRRLPLPLAGADECTATVGVQLTTGGSNGRVKVAVIAG